MNTFFKKIKTFVSAHKIWTVIIIIAIVGGVYYYVQKTKASQTTTTYTLSTVTNGTVITTVTGTGQVSANNQVAVNAQVSGTIDAINVSVGQKVEVGQQLAHIDSTSAQQSLQSAQLAYAQLTEAAKAGDITNAQDSLTQSYSNAFSS